MDAERDLSAALSSLLGGASGEWLVQTQRPEPDQPWSVGDAYWDLSVAIDEVISPIAGLPAGSLVRMGLDGSTAWLGLVTRSGAVAAAPPISSGVPSGEGWQHWDEAWNNPGVTASWMLRSCHGVEGPRVVLAGCACARVSLRSLTARQRPPIERALSVAEAACVGEATDAEARSAGKEIERLAKREPLGSLLRGSMDAAVWCCRGASGQGTPVKYAMLAADFEGARAWRSDLAEEVRRFIGLGEVLLGLHEAYARNAIWTIRMRQPWPPGAPGELWNDRPGAP